jgi:COMPASS component SWD1
VFVAAIFEAQPMLVDVSGDEPIRKPLPSAPKRSHAEGEVATEKQVAQDAKLTTTVATFSATGDHIIAGTNKGWLNIIDSNTCQTVLSSKLCSQLLILIRLSTSGRDMVVNSNDRIVRTFHLPDFSEPDLDFDTFQLNVEHKFQDLVNRLSWNHVAFSPTGEYVMASTYMNHDIYVWERGHGSLVKILEGGNEYAVVEVTEPHCTNS